MKDIYLVNKITGELLPSEQVISDFYKNHNILESVFDYYNETKVEVESTTISFPNFEKMITEF